MVKTFRRKHSTGNLSKKDADKTATAQLVVGWESERFKSSSHMETRQRDKGDALSGSSLRDSPLRELPDDTSRMSPVQLHTARMAVVRFLSGWTCQPRTSSTIPLTKHRGAAEVANYPSDDSQPVLRFSRRRAKVQLVQRPRNLR